MTTWIALLRGVNVGGHRKLPMAEFRALLGKLGYQNVATYIQSGNAVFRAEGEAQSLAQEISAAVEARFGFAPDIMMLTAEQLQAALAVNPFPAAEAAPTTLHLFFMNRPMPVVDLKAMQEAATRGEKFSLGDGVFYFHTPNGMGRSELGGKLTRFIKTPMTGRNLRSCHKILELAQGGAGA